MEVYFSGALLEFEIVLSPKEYPYASPEPSKRRRFNNFEECRSSLLQLSSSRLKRQQNHQQMLREQVMSNDEAGNNVMAALEQLGQRFTLDKLKLFTEEVDKITSLIIGLTSRLNKINRSLNQTIFHDSESQVGFNL